MNEQSVIIEWMKLASGFNYIRARSALVIGKNDVHKHVPENELMVIGHQDDGKDNWKIGVK